MSAAHPDATLPGQHKPMGALFEGSFLGDASKINDKTKLECGVCWWVYDPDQGDDVWQISPGVAFNALPSHWRCPHCDAEKHHFMVIGETGPRQAKDAVAPSSEGQRIATMRAAYHAVDKRMAGLPVYRDGFPIDLLGVRVVGEGLIGVVITPWAMNIIAWPLAVDHGERPEGSKRVKALPSGRYEFIAGRLDGVGFYESCSLFSPLDEFDDAEAARATAEAAAISVFEPDPDEVKPPPAPSPELSRRAMLTGQLSSRAEVSR